MAIEDQAHPGRKGPEIVAHLRLILRWRVLRALLALLREVGDAYEDHQLTPAERGRIMTAMWHLIRVYQGQRTRNGT